MAVAFVQSASNAAKAVSSLAKAFTSNNVAGNMLVLGVGVWKSGGGFNDPTVTDTAGNTWKLLLSTPRNISCAYIFVAYNCAVGANTVTVNVGTSSDIDFSIHEYSGCAHVTAMDQIMGGSSPSASSILAGTVTTQYANEVIFSFCYDQSHGAQTFTPSASWTLRQQTTNPDGASSASFDRIASSTGSFTNTISVSGGSSTGLHGLIVTFADTSSTNDLVQIASNSGIVSTLAATFLPRITLRAICCCLAIGRWKTRHRLAGNDFKRQRQHEETLGCRSERLACYSARLRPRRIAVASLCLCILRQRARTRSRLLPRHRAGRPARSSFDEYHAQHDQRMRSRTPPWRAPLASGNVNAVSAGLAFAMAYDQST
jgi:hypothetical protein